MNDLQASHFTLMDKLARSLKLANLTVAQEAAKEAADAAPVLSGRLRDSIHADDATEQKAVAQATISADAPYAAYVDRGTERQAAQPFMTETMFRLQNTAAARVAEKMR